MEKTGLQKQKRESAPMGKCSGETERVRTKRSDLSCVVSFDRFRGNRHMSAVKMILPEDTTSYDGKGCGAGEQECWEILRNGIKERNGRRRRGWVSFACSSHVSPTRPMRWHICRFICEFTGSLAQLCVGRAPGRRLSVWRYQWVSDCRKHAAECIRIIDGVPVKLR